jgi:glycosyltransferase involved in cell wall biosynthesis
VEGIRADKIVTIWNGIDVAKYDPPDAPRRRAAIRRELGIDDACQVVTTVGRLAPQKGHEHLIAAVPAILARAPQAHFLILGEGPLDEALAAQARATGLDESVHFLGVRDDVRDVLLGSDLFVLPSLWEGLPNVVLEAMAAGLAVVATSVDGTPELVFDGDTGVLVPPGEPEALAAAVMALLADPSRAAQLGAAGRRRAVAHFSHQRNTQAYVDLYTRILQTKSRGHRP